MVLKITLNSFVFTLWMQKSTGEAGMFWKEGIN